MKEFKLGDEVWDITRGNGDVIEVDKRELHPILVKFNGRWNEIYTADGKVDRKDINPLLYHGHNLKLEIKGG